MDLMLRPAMPLRTHHGIRTRTTSLLGAVPPAVGLDGLVLTTSHYGYAAEDYQEYSHPYYYCHEPPTRIERVSTGYDAVALPLSYGGMGPFARSRWAKPAWQIRCEQATTKPERTSAVMGTWSWIRTSITGFRVRHPAVRRPK